MVKNLNIIELFLVKNLHTKIVLNSKLNERTAIIKK